MSLSNIRSALVSAYVNGGFALPTAYENVSFEPTSGEAWAEFHLIPNQPEVATLGDTGRDHHDGIAQINLNYPPSTGTADILAKADAIRAVFKAGKSFIYSNQSVVIQSCGRGPARNIDGWFQIPLTINWYARTAR